MKWLRRATLLCLLPLAACSDALSLTDLSDPVARWYGPTERRSLVTEQNAEALNKGPRRGSFTACAAGSDAACLDLLRSLPPGALMRPLDYQARMTLLATAVRLGGPQSFKRLLESPPGPMGQRLAVAAGMSEGLLMKRWRADVLAARPAPVSLPPWGSWIALAWVALFATCGMWSSRWR